MQRSSLLAGQILQLSRGERLRVAHGLPCAGAPVRRYSDRFRDIRLPVPT